MKSCETIRKQIYMYGHRKEISAREYCLTSSNDSLLSNPPLHPQKTFWGSFPLPHLPTTPAHVAVHLVDTAASPDLDPVFRLLHGQERAGQELRHRALIREAPAPEPGDSRYITLAF